MLIGGWWYARDVPKDVADDPNQFHGSIPHRNKSVIQRIPDQQTPEWAEDYFRNPIRRHIIE